MDKTAIKNFAIEARKILMKSAISRAGFYGITADSIGEPIQKGADFEIYNTVAGTENRIFGSDIIRRQNLVDAIRKNGFNQVIEETAYTWFNRIIAIRFMEVNDYLPTRVRVLSSETGSSTPDIVTQAASVDLNLKEEELEKIQQAKNDNRYDDAFRMLFVKQCNELNAILPGLFEKTDDYMELLLKLSYTGDGVVRMLIDSIPEDNFNVEKEGQVEIIGWMYQYYNTELKDDTFAKLKKNVKISKERIPAATQLFTPDWIVRYMVENSVGRVWIDHLHAVDPSVDEKTKAEEFGWKYYLPEAEQEADVARELVEIRKSYKDITPQDITCIDPCMGSGHILVYMFDVLMDIYRSEGYSERNAVFDILEKNIYGLDIDLRAYQLSYFALMMKGRAYSGRRFFRGREDENGERIIITPNVYDIEESNLINREHLKFFGPEMDEDSKKKAMVQLNGLLDTMKDAKEYGSILNVENYDWELLRSFLSRIDIEGQMSYDSIGAEDSRKLILNLVEIGTILAKKYDAVITNPPYMGSGNMGGALSEFVKKYYPDTKSDMSTVFMEKTISILRKNGYMSMINIPVWMFISSYEKLRINILSNDTIINMVHMGRGIFGSDFGTTSFVISKGNLSTYRATYLRLFDNSGDVDSVETKEKWFLENKNRSEFVQENFEVIPANPIAYWASNEMLSVFKRSGGLGKVADGRKGLVTGNDDLYLKLWTEVSSLQFSPLSGFQNTKWKPCNKGGNYRKWYGNNDYVVNWGNDGKELADHRWPDGRQRSSLRNSSYFFKEAITWTYITSGTKCFRYYPEGFAFAGTGPCLYPHNKCDLYYILGYTNSIVFDQLLRLIGASTISLESGEVERAPIIIDKERYEQISILVKENVIKTKEDWDAFETSWDFKEHPIVRLSKDLWDATAIGASMEYYYGDHPKVSCPVELCYMLWQGECNERFKKLKDNEEDLNRIFIDIYGLQDELTPEVDDKDITVRKADLGRDIRSLISYAVGCMFGRYSLAKTGLVYAGGEFDNTLYGEYPVDEDAIIPITDEPYFDDDIVKRFEEFISLVYGADSLEDNLTFIADALGTKGTNPREKIRNYFLNDFFKDHCNTYSVTGSGKRPIYWLFDSGKQNGFKCLIYMHRYTPDTVGIIRSVYLKKAQDAIEKAMENAEYIINSDAGAVDKANAKKKHDKYVKQLNEIRPYYQALTHVALQKIDIDLDDGVKHNYQLFQDVEISGEGTKNQKIDLLAKI